MWGYDLTGGLAGRPDPQAARQGRGARVHAHAARGPARLGLPVLRRRRPTTPDSCSPSLRTAALEHGAVIANDVSAVGISKSSDGRADGVEVAVGADGRRRAVHHPHPVDRQRRWGVGRRGTDASTRAMTPTRSDRPRASTSRSPGTRCATRSPPSSRFRRTDARSSSCPAGRFTYIGTTDTDYDGPVDDPQCTAEPTSTTCSAPSTPRPPRPSPPHDVVGTWAGLRPLVKSANHRPHRRPVTTAPRRPLRRPGVVTITGRQADDLPRDGGRHRRRGHRAGPRPPDRLRRLPEESPPASSASVAPRATTPWPSRRVRSPMFRADLLDHLGTRYGGEARALMAAIQSDPTLADPIVAGSPVHPRRGHVRRPPRDGPVGRRPAVDDAPGPASWPATTPALAAAEVGALLPPS